MEAYLAGITGELAEQLTEGKPCPVCGSISHPHKAIKVDNSITKVMVDFPFFGQNGHVPEEIEVHSTRPGYIYQPLVGSDDFCNGLLPRWQFNHNPDPRYYHLDALQGTYTITTREVCTELTQAVNTLTQRMSYPSCAAEVTVDASALKEGDVAGLCALQSCYAAVGITKHHGKYKVIMLDKKEDGILDMTEGTVVESHQMDFRLEADFCNMKDEARCYYRVNKGDWLPIGTVHKLYFKLDHFTGCRFGLFCYAAEETESGRQPEAEHLS